MKIKLSSGIVKQLDKDYLIQHFQYFEDYFQSSIYKNEEQANLGQAYQSTRLTTVN